jgi:hypothetical protein
MGIGLARISECLKQKRRTGCHPVKMNKTIRTTSTPLGVLYVGWRTPAVRQAVIVEDAEAVEAVEDAAVVDPERPF